MGTFIFNTASMEKIDFKKQNIPFTQVANAVLNDTKISLGAKGLYAYLYSKPEGWDFETMRIARDSKNGRDAVRAFIKELESSGYLERIKLNSGRMVYSVVFPPMTEIQSQPMTGNATVGKTQLRDSSHISNKEKKVIKNINNKEYTDGTNQVLKVFYDTINPTINFANQAYRKASQELVEKFGVEKTVNMAKYAISVQSEKYAPSISNPLQLKDKYPQLLKFYNSHKPEKKYEYNND